MDRLPDSEQVSLAVAKPGGALALAALARIVALHPGDPVLGPEPRKVVLLEDDPAIQQLLDDRVEVLDLEAHLRVLPRRLAARLEQRELAGATAVEQPTRSLLDRLEAELLRVERPRPIEVLGRKAGSDLGVLEH